MCFAGNIGTCYFPVVNHIADRFPPSSDLIYNAFSGIRTLVKDIAPEHLREAGKISDILPAFTTVGF